MEWDMYGGEKPGRRPEELAGNKKPACGRILAPEKKISVYTGFGEIGHIIGVCIEIIYILWVPKPMLLFSTILEK
jgi:hypothetical protein